MDIHLGAQIGLVCTLCVHAWVCMHTHVPHCARTPRKSHQGKRHGARAAGGWQIQGARRRQGAWDEKRARSLLGITRIGPNPDPVETFETQTVPHRGRARTHRCAHAHTGGHALTAEGGAGLAAAGLLAGRQDAGGLAVTSPPCPRRGRPPFHPHPPPPPAAGAAVPHVVLPSCRELVN